MLSRSFLPNASFAEVAAGFMNARIVLLCSIMDHDGEADASTSHRSRLWDQNSGQVNRSSRQQRRFDLLDNQQQPRIRRSLHLDNIDADFPSLFDTSSLASDFEPPQSFHLTKRRRVDGAGNSEPPLHAEKRQRKTDLSFNQRTATSSNSDECTSHGKAVADKGSKRKRTVGISQAHHTSSNEDPSNSFYPQTPHDHTFHDFTRYPIIIPHHGVQQSHYNSFCGRFQPDLTASYYPRGFDWRHFYSFSAPVEEQRPHSASLTNSTEESTRNLLPSGPSEAERREAGSNRSELALEHWYSLLRELHLYKAKYGNCQYTLFPCGSRRRTAIAATTRLVSHNLSALLFIRPRPSKICRSTSFGCVGQQATHGI